MEKELQALKENDTYKLVPRNGHETITGRWVFAKKFDAKNNEVFRARFVAKGFQQTYNVNFGETFSPTAKMTTIRILIDLSVRYNLIIHQLDACSAYLQAKINYDIYIEQPEGFIEKDKNGEDLLFKIEQRSLWIKTKWKIVE